MTTDIDDKLRELVLNGSAYQARELAHALDLAEWSELLDLLLDHWDAEQTRYGTLVWPNLTPKQCEAVVQHNDRLVKHDARLMLTSTIGACFSSRYKAVRLCRHVMRLNPDIRARVHAEAAA